MPSPGGVGRNIKKLTGIAKQSFRNANISNSLNQLGLKDGFRTTTSNALNIAEKYLGKGYRDLGKGRFA